MIASIKEVRTKIPRLPVAQHDLGFRRVLFRCAGVCFGPCRLTPYSNDDVLIPMNVIRQKRRVVFDQEAVSEEDMTDRIGREFARRIRIGAGNFQAFFWLIDFLRTRAGAGRGFAIFSHKVTRWFSPFLCWPWSWRAALRCGLRERRLCIRSWYRRASRL